MAKAKIDLVAACKELPPRRTGWQVNATQEQMEQMQLLREAFHRGEIVASVRHIHGTVKAVLNLNIGRNALGDFLNEGRPTKQAQR